MLFRVLSREYRLWLTWMFGCKKHSSETASMKNWWFCSGIFSLSIQRLIEFHQIVYLISFFSVSAVTASSSCAATAEGESADNAHLSAKSGFGRASRFVSNFFHVWCLFTRLKFFQIFSHVWFLYLSVTLPQSVTFTLVIQVRNAALLSYLPSGINETSVHTLSDYS